VLLEAGLQFEDIKVDELSKVIEGGGDYRAINPLGFVPALYLDDNTVITEVAAIVFDLLGTIQALEACGVDLYLDQHQSTRPHPLAA
jgi:hypothetical protein